MYGVETESENLKKIMRLEICLPLVTQQILSVIKRNLYSAITHPKRKMVFHLTN